MPRQIAFSEYEAALLLDAYLRVLRGEMSRRNSVQECSTHLRQMALNAGKHIDDVYRNVNGISFQMASMESAYQGQTIMKPATRLFTQIVDLYRNDTAQYQKLLMEAKEMAKTNEGSEEVFLSWLSKNVSGALFSELYIALHEIEVQAKKDRLIKLSLYEKLDPTSIRRIKTSIERSRFFRNTHKKQWSRILLALSYLLKYSVQERSVQKAVVANYTGSDTTSTNKESSLVPVEKDSDIFEQRKDESKDENVESMVIATSEAVIDFENIGEVSFSKPVSLSYFGETKQENTWKGMYVDACKYLLDDYPDVFERLKKENLSGISKAWLVDESHLSLLSVPKKIQEMLIYADNAATTKLDEEVFEAMKPWLLDNYGNASQPYSFSRKPKEALKQARQIIASCINADPEEIYFTSGGTESDNWAIKGTMYAHRDYPGLITSQVEHHAILHSATASERMGYPVSYLPVNSECVVLPTHFRNYFNCGR